MSSPPPLIGSAAWDRELEGFGVARSQVDALLRDALGGADPATVSPHSVCFSAGRVLDEHPDGRFAAELRARGLEPSLEGLDEGGPCVQEVLEAAAWFLFHEQQPSYGTMMNLRHKLPLAIEERSAAGRYCVRQLAAAIVHGSAAVVDSIWYYLAVDPFEAREEALALFPLLVDELPAPHHEDLVDLSGHVTWAAKRDFYLRCANDPESHDALAHALERSCRSGFFTSVDPREGLSLLRRLEGIDPSIRCAIEQVLSSPIRAWVAAVAEVDRAASHRFPGACLVALAWLGDFPPSWLWDSELWIGSRFLGRFLRSKYGNYPEGERALPSTIRREAQTPPPPDVKATIEWHVVWGASEELAEHVGAAIELVGPGMR